MVSRNVPDIYVEFRGGYVEVGVIGIAGSLALISL
jgi:hypothetical protein